MNYYFSFKTDFNEYISILVFHFAEDLMIFKEPGSPQWLII